MLIAPLEDTPMLGNTKPPVGHGKLFKLIVLPLDNLRNTAPVSGDDLLVSASGTVPEEYQYLLANFPYMLIGAPSGIISFSKTVDGEPLLLYSDFIERGGVYYFKRNDVEKYGNISTASGTPMISFAVSSPNDNITAFQDNTDKYSGSGDFESNIEIQYRDSESGILYGNGKLSTLSCGLKTSLKPVKLTKIWTEGGSLFALSDTGELLKDSLGTESDVDGSCLAAGEPITDKSFSQCLLYPYQGKLYCILGASDVDLTEQNLGEIIPELTGGTVSYGTVADALSERGYITVVRYSDYPATYTQKAVERRINKLSTQYLANYAEITVTAPEVSYLTGGTYSVPGAPEYNYIYVYYTTDSRKEVMPLVYRGISPRTAIYGNFPEFGVLRIAVQDSDGCKIAITDNGEIYNRDLRCGDIIKAISFVGNTVSGYPPQSDVILNHITIPEITVGAGGSAVLVLKDGE